MINNEKKYSVYMHKCPNGMIYVGCTSLKPSRRWNGGRGYCNNQMFAPLIKQYGWNNIEHYTVASGLDKEVAEHMESRLIQLTKSQYTLNTQKTTFTGWGEWDCDYLKPILEKGRLKMFYGDAFNYTLGVELIGFPITNWISTTTPMPKTPSLNLDNSEVLTTKISGKMKKVKKQSKIKQRVNGACVELMFDNRYLKEGGKYPVCIRVYANKKYTYIATGYDVTPQEFEFLPIQMEQDLYTKFNKVRDWLVTNNNGGWFDLDALKGVLSGGVCAGQTLCDIMLEKAALANTEGTEGNYQSVVKNIKLLYPDGLEAKKVGLGSIKRYKEWLEADGFKPATVSIYLSVVRASINYGIYKGYLKPEQYPFKRSAMEIDKITLPQSDKRDDHYLLKGDMQKLWVCFKQTKNRKLGWFFFSYLHGGINLADMMSLRFTDFYFQEGGFVYQRAKTRGKNHFKVVVPATSWTNELFQTLNITPTKGELVFPEMGGLSADDKGYSVEKNRLSNNANSIIKNCAKKAGIEKCVSMTTARHSFATIATKERIPSTVVEQCMGHAFGGVSSHYIARWDVGEMRADMEKLL